LYNVKIFFFEAIAFGKKGRRKGEKKLWSCF